MGVVAAQPRAEAVSRKPVPGSPAKNPAVARADSSRLRASGSASMRSAVIATGCAVEKSITSATPSSTAMRKACGRTATMLSSTSVR